MDRLACLAVLLTLFCGTLAAAKLDFKGYRTAADAADAAASMKQMVGTCTRRLCPAPVPLAAPSPAGAAASQSQLTLRCASPSWLLFPSPGQDRRTLFGQWKAENGKVYPTRAAENAAFAAFNAAVTDVISHNSNKSNKFFKGAQSRRNGHAARGD